MSEIKPVYQLRYGTGDVEVTEEQYFRESYMRGTPRRMLYHAAAYEALKAENEKLKAHYEGALDSIREHQQICNELKAENEASKNEIMRLTETNWKFKELIKDLRERIKKLEAEQKYRDHM